MYVRCCSSFWTKSWRPLVNFSMNLRSYPMEYCCCSVGFALSISFLVLRVFASKPSTLFFKNWNSRQKARWAPTAQSDFFKLPLWRKRAAPTYPHNMICNQKYRSSGRPSSSPQLLPLATESSRLTAEPCKWRTIHVSGIGYVSAWLKNGLQSRNVIVSGFKSLVKGVS